MGMMGNKMESSLGCLFWGREVILEGVCWDNGKQHGDDMETTI